MNEKLSITLPAELVATINEEVASGRYASPSDLLQQAVESLIREDEGFVEPDLDHMRARIKQSLEDPRPSVSLEETRKHMDDFIDRLYHSR